MPSFVAGYLSRIYVDKYNVGQYFATAEDDRSLGLVDNTTFGNTSHSRFPTIFEGGIKAGGYWDGAVGALDELLQAAFANTAGRALSFGPGGDAAGQPALLCTVRTAKYSVKASPTTLVSTDAEWLPDQATRIAIAAGVWLQALAALSTSTSQTTAVDGGAATTAGWIATLHCVTVAGASVSGAFRLQDSANNSVWADVSGGAFTTLTATGSQILYSAVGATLRQYVRLAWVITGGGTIMTVAAAVARQ